MPELRGKLADPEKSKLRLSLDDFKTIDARTRADGQPKGWRLSHRAREVNRIRDTFEQNRSAALAEWRQLAA